VHNPQPGQIQPDRQGLKPLQGFPVGRRTLSHLEQKFFMLLFVLLTVRSEKTSRPVRLGPAKGVELMVAHDCQRSAGVTHASRDNKHLALLRSAVDKVSYKNHPAVRVPKDSVVIAIFHFPQQATQHLCMTVNIANEIVVICNHEFLSFRVCVHPQGNRRRYSCICSRLIERCVITVFVTLFFPHILKVIVDEDSVGLSR
jgi:hypothetical protein